MASLRDLFNLDQALDNLCIETEKKDLYQAAVDQAFAFIEQETCIKGLFDYDVDEEIALVFNDQDGHCWENRCGSFPTLYEIGLWRSITCVEYRKKAIGPNFNDVSKGWMCLTGGDYCFGNAEFNIKRPVNEAVPDGKKEYVRPVTTIERPSGECCTCGFFPHCAEIRISGYFGFREMPPEFMQIINDCLKDALLCERQLATIGGSGGSTTTSGGQEVLSFLKSEKTHTKSKTYEHVVVDGPSSSTYSYDYSRSLTSDSNKNILSKYCICKQYSL